MFEKQEEVPQEHKPLIYLDDQRQFRSPDAYERLAEQYTYCPSCGCLKKVNQYEVCGFCMVGGVA